MPFFPLRMNVAGVTSRNLQHNLSLTYHVSLVISNVRSCFQNIGSSMTIYVKILRLTVSLSLKIKKIRNLGRSFPVTTFPGFPALYHIHAFCRTSYESPWVSWFLITLDGMILRDCWNYISFFVSDYFWDFWWKWLEHAVAPTCIHVHTACCSIEYSLW